MTNERAIKILENMPVPYFILNKEPITFEEMAEAIEMAIEALKNERPQGEEDDKIKNGTDCMDEDAKQASIPYTYNAPQHDWKCGYSSAKHSWVYNKIKEADNEYSEKAERE